MKKTALFIAVISALSLASCKKDRICTCTTVHSNGTNTTTTTSDVTYVDAKKGDAKKACISETETSSSTFGGVTYTNTSTSTCELK